MSKKTGKQHQIRRRIAGIIFGKGGIGTDKNHLLCQTGTFSRSPAAIDRFKLVVD